MQKKLLLFPSLLILGMVCAQPLKIEISAGNHNRSLTPIQIHLTKPLNSSKNYVLRDPKTGKQFPAQLLDSLTLVFILEDSLPSNTTKAYQLRTTSSNLHKPVAIQQQAEGLLVK